MNAPAAAGSVLSEEIVRAALVQAQGRRPVAEVVPVPGRGPGHQDQEQPDLDEVRDVEKPSQQG